MKKTLCALIAGATLALAGAAQAGVINFDDVATGGDFTSLSDMNPYGGLSWGADWYAGDTGIAGAFASSAHSGANFAINGFGNDPVGIGSATAFSFAGAWFAAPAVDDKASWINISAYDVADHLIGSTGPVAIGANYQWVEAAGFDNVSYLSITRDSGWYVMDDFTTRDAATVPEPGTQLMLGIGLLALVAGRRRSAR